MRVACSTVKARPDRLNVGCTSAVFVNNAEKEGWPFYFPTALTQVRRCIEPPMRNAKAVGGLKLTKERTSLFPDPLKGTHSSRDGSQGRGDRDSDAAVGSCPGKTDWAQLWIQPGHSGNLWPGNRVGPNGQKVTERVHQESRTVLGQFA